VMIGSPVFNLEEPGRAVRPAMLLSCSRREALLAAAIALFGRHGYTQVTMEQIGARVGIAAPSVYTYFSRKDEMLETALTRATVASRLELNRALASSNSPQEAVRCMIHSHCEFVFDYPDTVRLLLTEVIHLGEAAGTRFREAQADCISDWSMVVGILTPASPTLDVRIRVHAVLAMLNDIGTSSYPRRHANVLPILTGIALPVLTTPT
jgi:AcrR family transcriptional regulator